MRGTDVQGQGTVGDLGDDVHQKLQQNVKLVYNFFTVQSLGLMSLGA